MTLNQGLTTLPGQNTCTLLCYEVQPRTRIMYFPQVSLLLRIWPWIRIMKNHQFKSCTLLQRLTESVILKYNQTFLTRCVVNISIILYTRHPRNVRSTCRLHTMYNETGTGGKNNYRYIITTLDYNNTITLYAVLISILCKS